MTLLGFILLLVVAFVAGAIGEAVAGGKTPGGWLGSIIAGFIGSWIGGALFHFGPVIQGIQIIPAIIGAALFVFVLRLLFHGAARTRTHRPVVP